VILCVKIFQLSVVCINVVLRFVNQNIQKISEEIKLDFTLHHPLKMIVSGNLFTAYSNVYNFACHY